MNYAATMIDSFAAQPTLASAGEVGAVDSRAAALALQSVSASIAIEPGLAPQRGVSAPAPLLGPASIPVSAKSQLSAVELSALSNPSADAPGLAAALAPAFAPGGTSAINIASQLVTRIDGKAAGVVDFQQTATGLAVRLGSLAQVLSDRFTPAEIARIEASSASNTYLSLGQLQAQGIPISYDPVYDEFNVGLTDTRPAAARKVHIDQISTPERGLGSTGIDQARR